MNGKKVLVTGGAGFIGSHLVDALVLRGNDVVVYDDLSSGRMEFLDPCMGRIDFLKRDLVTDKKLADLLKDIDHVYHLAANPDVRIGADDTWTSVEQNIIATYNLLEAMRISRPDDPPSISFTSTSTVYGNAAVLPTPEDYGPLMPISQYGASKLAAEALISAFSDNFGMKASVFRFANVVGSRSTHGILFDLYHKLKRDPTRLEILGDGLQRKSYIHVSDCVDAVLHATETQRSMFEYYNIGTKDHAVINQIPLIIIEAMGLKDVEVYYTGGHKGAGWKGDVKFMSLAVNKILATGWEFRYDSIESLKKAAKEIISDQEASISP
ncbi:MAG: NAD-dependent epimerase/dehydratase family protein [Candidatus Thermoplasmatota archaeon]|nr:NAD-dependent epimerase/dehydratase family protein [Candidatus Thermoplasmatota archaeon]